MFTLMFAVVVAVNPARRAVIRIDPTTGLTTVRVPVCALPVITARSILLDSMDHKAFGSAPM